MTETSSNAVRISPAQQLTPLPEWMRTAAVSRVMAALDGAGEASRFIGGCVRDTLAERKVGDIDIATTRRPEAVIACLERAGIRNIPTGLDHGTVTAVVDHRPFEITTLRRDMACDGRHAEVAYTHSWEADAQRRDFTINALSLTGKGELYDYTGGLDDLREGRVRFIGDPAARIREDYLRILRFFRFHAGYGRGAPDSEGLAACAARAGGLERLSGERIQTEMVKLLLAAQPTLPLTAMQETGILRHILPEGANIHRLARLIKREEQTASPTDWRRRLACLFQGALSGKQSVALAERWKLSRADRDALAALLDIAPPPEAAHDAAIRRYLRQWGRDMFRGAVLLDWARQEKTDAARDAHYRSLLHLAETWEIPVFPLAGMDIVAAGIPQGRAVGEWLRRLEARWEESGYVLDKEALLAELRSTRHADRT